MMVKNKEPQVKIKLDKDGLPVGFILENFTQEEKDEFINDVNRWSKRNIDGSILLAEVYKE